MGLYALLAVMFPSRTSRGPGWSRLEGILMHRIRGDPLVIMPAHDPVSADVGHGPCPHTHPRVAARAMRGLGLVRCPVTRARGGRTARPRACSGSPPASRARPPP